MSKPSLDASGIAEYIHFQCCPRYFKLRFEGKEEQKDRAWAEAFKPISPLLYGSGENLEEEKWKEFKAKASKCEDLRSFDPKKIGWDEAWEKSKFSLREAIEVAQVEKDRKKPILLYQIPLLGSIGAWRVVGKADLIAIWQSEKQIKLRLFEIKASWKERTYHRMQVAIYSLLLSNLFKKWGFEVSIEGGIIYKKTELTELDPEKLPWFDLQPIIEDAKRLLGENGELLRIHQQPLAQVEYQLSWKCESCIYNECCFTRAIEGESIALLNLTRGEQRALRKHGLTKIEDLARLKTLLNYDEQVPYNFREVRVLNPEKTKELYTNPTIGKKLDSIIQRAQSILQGIRPSSEFATRRKALPWITATGDGNLPEDNPTPNWNIDLGFMRGSLVRIYLHIQWDYMLDVLAMISARVSCTLYNGNSLEISKIIEQLPEDRESVFDYERKMLESFFIELSRAIQHIANEIGSPMKIPIHLYFYTALERDRLMDAVRRQPSLLSALAIRDLLGLREAIDQPMFSIIQDEMIDRKALKYANLGLLPVLDQCGWFDNKEWLVKIEDGSLINLHQVFYQGGFFNYASPYRREADGSMHLMLERGASSKKEVEGFYPVRARFGSQIPLEYFWGAKGKLDPSKESGWNRVTIEKRIWRDYPLKTKRITEEDLTLLGKKLCQVLEHIERSLEIRNLRLGKEPIDVPRIEEFSLGETNLHRGCNEYLSLEYFSRRHELYRYYALMPSQRVASGRSLILRSSNIIQDSNSFLIRGRLVYEGLGFPNVQQIINACRIKGSDGFSSGDWMVATEVEFNENGQIEEVGVRRPSRIERGARVIVENIDTTGLEITIRVLSWPSRGDFCKWHNLPTTDPNEAEKGYMQLFQEGRMYILDEMGDNLVSKRSKEALDHIASNPLYQILDDYLSGIERNHTKNELLKDHAQKFTEWLKKRAETPLKSEQLAYVDISLNPNKIVTLQGPPGTGKTETLQSAILAHVVAHKDFERCRVLLVAPTHKAIHECITKLADSWRNYRFSGGNDLDGLRIIRVISNENSIINRVEGVTYVNYHEDQNLVIQLGNWLWGQVVLDESILELNRPIILCATPAGIYSLLKKISTDNRVPWGHAFFDLLAIDEASMMRLPELILSGAFIRRDAQVLLAGDHRQLPPIQAHNWEKEDRRTIEEIAPFLSAQDFIRFLRNEDMGLDHVTRHPPAGIPVVRLKKTYRCHKVVAEFLRKWVYSKDKIDFQSDEIQTLCPVSPPTEGLKIALDPENVLVLIVHSEGESYQSNIIEVRIVQTIVKMLANEEIGVITPHNAQRGLLKSALGDIKANLRVDTVERFQGGQSDCIIISGTVSDPDYIRAESDFLLNINRLNVAISRMKKKLIVIASQSIFEYMPTDARDYDKAILWRGLLQTVGFTEGRTPSWKGTLREFTGSPGDETELKIYTLSSERK